MSEHAVVFDEVYKKFRRGELYDSLRDLIPALVGRTLRSRDLAARREFWALRGLSFSVPHGQAIGIIGRNGAGKSTILKLLSGILQPTRGRVSVHGRLSALIEVGAGFHPDLTGRENVFLNGAIVGMSREEIRRKFDAIVEFAGLKDFIDTPVKRYSSGMFARLGFAVAAHVDPEVLMVDEVLSVGDYVFQNRCFDRMQEIVRSGATVLFVSHNMQAIASLCDRCLLIEDGRLVRDGSSEEVISSYLERGQRDRSQPTDAKARITAVEMRDASGPRLKFDSGDAARLEIDFVAHSRLENLAVALEVRDHALYRIFNTSSERLGYPTLSLEPGERRRVRFDLRLHTAAGTFHVGVFLFRSDIERVYDHWFPCATFYVSTDRDVRGAVNLLPEVAFGPSEGP